MTDQPVDDDLPVEDLTEEDAEDLEGQLVDVDPDAADEPILDDGEDA